MIAADKPMAKYGGEDRMMTGGFSTAIIGRSVVCDAPDPSTTVTEGVKCPMAAYAWVTIGPAAFGVPSPKSQRYSYGAPEPPLATEMKVIAAPGAADDAVDVPVTRRSAIVTGILAETVPPASSRPWTNTEYWPASRSACVTVVPAHAELPPNTQGSAA